jgi:hypothetical protein
MQIFNSQNLLTTKCMWSIGCDNITTEVMWTTEFSGLQIDNTLTEKHIINTL